MSSDVYPNIPRLLRRNSAWIGSENGHNEDTFLGQLMLNAADEIERLQVESAYWKEKAQHAQMGIESASLILSSSLLDKLLRSESINDIDSEPLLFAISRWIDENSNPSDTI